MFKNMKVGAKIASGFAIIAILGVIVGIAGYLIVNNIIHQVEVAETAYTIKQDCFEARRQEKNFLIRREEKYIERWEKVLEGIRTVVAKGLKVTDDSDIQAWLKDIFKKMDRYAAMGHSLQKAVSEGHKLDNQMRNAARSIESSLKKDTNSGPAMTALLHARQQEKNIILYGDKTLGKGEKSYLRKWKDRMDIIEKWSGDDAGLKSLTTRYSGLMSQRVKGLERVHDLEADIVATVGAVMKNADQILERTKKAMHKAEIGGKTLIMII
ncbi:MAG: hypothetical protein J7M20_01125, partial [Deltaproteobacteria bacterium]|nr:hypothetical protein [Deltaproteobacteria bacterium]